MQPDEMADHACLGGQQHKRFAGKVSILVHLLLDQTSWARHVCIMTLVLRLICDGLHAMMIMTML